MYAKELEGQPKFNACMHIHTYIQIKIHIAMQYMYSVCTCAFLIANIPMYVSTSVCVK